MPSQQNQSVNLGADFITETSSAGLPWRLMIFSLILFVFALLGYLGLKFGYESYVNAQIQEIDKKSEALNTAVSDGEQKEFLTFYSQMFNLKQVLNGRNYSYNLFKFLENNTISRIYYDSADYSAAAAAAQLKGRADSMNSLVEQLSIFNKAPELQKTSLKSLSLDQGFVNFEVTIFFKPEFFNQPL